MEPILELEAELEIIQITNGKAKATAPKDPKIPQWKYNLKNQRFDDLMDTA